MSVRGPARDHQGPGGSGGLSGEELVGNMMALDAGLHRIEDAFSEHVLLAYEDPVTFGAGHFVLYPPEGSSPRFVIEEQYPPGVDWSDDDRVPTSWAWTAEARQRQPDGTHPWVSLAEGEIASADYTELLDLAEGWAKTVHDLAVREEALTPEPLTSPGEMRADQQRTFLT